jgi:hypothetical protein
MLLDDLQTFATRNIENAWVAFDKKHIDNGQRELYF